MGGRSGPDVPFMLSKIVVLRDHFQIFFTNYDEPQGTSIKLIIYVKELSNYETLF